MKSNRIYLWAVGGALIVVGVLFAALPKDWIEETLGFEPDGGNGMVELLIVLVPIVAGLGLLTYAYLSRRSAARRASLP